MEYFQSLKVIYEDNHLIAVNKPPGILVHGDKTNDVTLQDMVKRYVKDRYKKAGDVYLGVIHRIDRPVSGVVIFARTSKGLSRMNKLLQSREITKTYYAITGERPKELNGRLEHYLLKDRSRNTVRVLGSDKKGAKLAVMDYELSAQLSGYTFLKLSPLTGRPHQIRAQLSQIGCPIVGDLRYGYRKPNEDYSICLHCYAMEFEHPVKKIPITITADLPEMYYWRFFSVD